MFVNPEYRVIKKRYSGQVTTSITEWMLHARPNLPEEIILPSCSHEIVVIGLKYYSLLAFCAHQSSVQIKNRSLLMPFFPSFRSLFLSLALVATMLLTSALFLSSGARAAQDAKLTRTLTLSATGTINSKPDMATITTGIETEAVKARDALDDNTDIMALMMKSLKNRGLDDRDIVTTQFSVQPRFQHFKTGRASKVIGYRVTNALRITIRDLVELGSILDRLVTLGSNHMDGIEFGLKNPDKALNEARKEAMLNAIDKAELYARAAGINLGPITSISEQTNRFAPPPMAFRAKRAMASVPIAPGQHTTSVTVHVKWALVD
jgi:uncharacterized protein YggE